MKTLLTNKRLLVVVLVFFMVFPSSLADLVTNPNFRPAPTGSNLPASAADYILAGNARYGALGDPARESSGYGIRFNTSTGQQVGKFSSGSVSTTASGINALAHRWFRLHIRALAQEEFHVDKDDLYLQAEFFGTSESDRLDKIKKRIYPQVRQERQALADPGTNRSLGTATWRTYAMEFRTPFPHVDSIKLTLGFSHGSPKGVQKEFWVNEFHFEPIAPPDHFRSRQATISRAALASLIPLGGRWYYDPAHTNGQLPRQFDYTNVNRLLYLSDKLEAPFVGNTSAWLKDGFYDAQGKMVKQARFIPDNLVVRFTREHLVMQSHNIPNHPTAFFPDIWRALDGNPNQVREMLSTWHLPLNPSPNPGRVAMTESNRNNALPGGPIGVAVNGVVFFNPYDMERTQDAIWRLDRCCGHPAPNAQYHYHKYPVCIKSPWSDDGSDHSPLIGFAFDGFPVYGPYEAKGVLAKNSGVNPLNEFNVHQDSKRGWHYHVTPGEFPHIIGGYFGHLDSRNRPTPVARRGGPRPGSRPRR